MAGYRSAVCCHFCRCLQKVLCVDTDSLFDVPDILVHYIWREVNLSFFFNIQTGIYSLTIIKMSKTLSKNRRGLRTPTPVIQPLYSYNCKLNELIPLSAPFLDWECLCCQASYPASMLWSKLLSNKNIATGSKKFNQCCGSPHLKCMAVVCVHPWQTREVGLQREREISPDRMTRLSASYCLP